MTNTDPNHIHTYDAQGRMTYCTQEERIYTKAGAEKLLHQEHSSAQDDEHADAKEKSGLKKYLPAIISLTMLLIGIALDNYLKPYVFTGYIRFAWYAIGYLPVGFPVMKEGWQAILGKEFFIEFTLMVLATVGGFCHWPIPRRGGSNALLCHWRIVSKRSSQ